MVDLCDYRFCAFLFAILTDLYTDKYTKPVGGKEADDNKEYYFFHFAKINLV